MNGLVYNIIYTVFCYNIIYIYPVQNSVKTWTLLTMYIRTLPRRTMVFAGEIHFFNLFKWMVIKIKKMYLKKRVLGVNFGIGFLMLLQTAISVQCQNIILLEMFHKFSRFFGYCISLLFFFLLAITVEIYRSVSTQNP